MKKDNKNEEVVLFAKNKPDRPPESIKRREPLVMMKKQQGMVPASQASPVLFSAKGRWPFDFIPDELIIEEKRIIIKRKFFPFTSTITTVPMNKLTNFEVTHSIFYSSVHIKAPLVIDTVFQWMKNSDAQEAKELIDGIRMRDNESIVVMEQDRNRFIQTLELIGQT